MSARKRKSPVNQRSRLIPALLGAAIVVVGFATLMMRLEVTQEGYRLSAVRVDIATLEDQNRRLRLTAAQLASHERLRALAPKYHLEPPRSGQVVIVP
jgi:cell division protein FtsL